MEPSCLTCYTTDKRIRSHPLHPPMSMLRKTRMDERGRLVMLGNGRQVRMSSGKAGSQPRQLWQRQHWPPGMGGGVFLLPTVPGSGSSPPDKRSYIKLAAQWNRYSDNLLHSGVWGWVKKTRARLTESPSFCIFWYFFGIFYKSFAYSLYFLWYYFFHGILHTG